MEAQRSEAEYRQVVVQLADLLDGVQTAKVNSRKHHHAAHLHGLTFYVRDTARAALLLIDSDMSASVAVLTRVAFEHAAMAQWIAIEPNGPDKYRKELDAQTGSAVKAAEKVGVVIPAGLWPFKDVKPVQEIRQTAQMFAVLEPSGMWYAIWKELSEYIHPSNVTASRYFDERAASGTLSRLRRGEPVPTHPFVATLALSMSLATTAYLDLVKAKPYKSKIAEICRPVGVPMWATPDGRSPK